MKKIFLFSLFALSSVFVLASCGDDTTPNKDNDNTNTDNGSGGNGTTDGGGTTNGGNGTNNGGNGTTTSDGVKVYAAPNDTYPVYLMTYVKDSKLDTFMYMKGSAPSICKVEYNNNTPSKVKVWSFNDYFGISTNQTNLDGNSPIYFTNISSNAYYPIPVYSYAEYKDNAINVKSAGLDSYKIKLNGDVESTYFKKVDSTGLKIGFYDNKFENNKITATSVEGKMEMTFDGTKLITNNYIARGDKYSNYGQVTCEVKADSAETKTTRSYPLYKDPIDYSSISASIDSNFNVTSVTTTSYIKNIQSVQNVAIAETPITSTKTCTVLDNNKYKIAYTKDSINTEVTLTYDSGKIKKIEMTGDQYFDADYDYQNNNEIIIDMVIVNSAMIMTYYEIGKSDEILFAISSVLPVPLQ